MLKARKGCTTRFNNIAIDSYLKIQGQNICFEEEHSYFVATDENCLENGAMREDITMIGNKEAFTLKISGICLFVQGNWLLRKTSCDDYNSYFIIEF